MRNLIPVFVASALALTAVMADHKHRSTASNGSILKSPGQASDPPLSKADVAGDEMLSLNFARIDADADGYVSKREYTAYAKHLQSPKREAFLQ